MNVEKTDRKLFHSVKQIILEARKEVYKKTNTALLNMYWEIGRLIIDSVLPCFPNLERSAYRIELDTLPHPLPY